jgi:uncharacterized oxidoreductase
MDFATSITAEGKVKVALARGEKLPDGYLVDGHGWPTSDPAAYYSEPKGAILPVAGHKGYALAVFADLLAGGLTGGLCSQANLDRVANGMLGLFLDPQAFAGTEAYNIQAEGLAAWLKSSKPREGFDEVLLPGEPETRTAAIRARNGIPVEDETWNKLRTLARELALPAEMTL